jgi:hypothetical protein
MTARRSSTITCTAIAATVVALVAAGATRAGARPRGVIADCSSRSEASFPGAFTNRRNLVVGPLVLIGAGGTAWWGRTIGGNKFPLLVRAGHRVTLELSARTRTFAGLAYGPLPQGEIHLRDAHRVVTFIACPRGQRSGSSADGQPVTFWSGGVLAGSPRCVPLLVWVDAASSPRRVVIHFGVRSCG